MKKIGKKQKQICSGPPKFPAWILAGSSALNVIFILTLTTCLFTIPAAFCAKSEKKLKPSLKKYTKALEKNPDSAILHYDLGCIYYEMKDYEKAIESFYKGLLTDDKSLELKAHYNLGNSKYQLGMLREEKNQLAEAANLYKDVLEHYRNVIEENPNDKDAKYNFELVQKKLKELLEKIKKQPKKEGQSQQKDKQSPEQDEQKQCSLPQEQEKQGEEKKNSVFGTEEEKKKEKEEHNASYPQEENKEMTEEEARMLLESFAQREMQRKMEEKNKENVTYSQEYKDW